MKVDFRKSIEFVPSWKDNQSLPKDEQLKLVLSPLEVGEALHIAALLQEAGHEGAVNDAGALEATKRRLSIDQTKGLVEACAKYVEPHVTSITGNDGFDLKDVVKFMFFLPLAADILFELVRISQPTDTDVKNSKPQPA